MNQDYYSILGLAKTATAAEIKKSYKKLASAHHPDKGGDAEKFKTVKEAYEVLSDTERRALYDRTGTSTYRPGNSTQPRQDDINDILRQMREAAMRQHANAVPIVNLRIPIKEAFNGMKIPIEVFGQSVGYQLRPGLPTGVSYTDRVKINDKEKDIHLSILVDGGNFAFKSPGSNDGVNYSGDLITLIDVEALTLYTGGWIIVTDFVGAQLQVRVPAGFDPNTQLKVAKHGYSNWKTDKAVERGDLYLKVRPVFSPIKNLPKETVEEFITGTKS